MTGSITIKDKHIESGWQTAPNISTDMTSSIHDDKVAQKLGFGGGLVSGIVLIELFPPLLLKAFGSRWFERGSVSLYFSSPIIEGEEVKTTIGLPPEEVKDAQVSAQIERPDGRIVAEGTVAVGDPDVPSAVFARKLDRYPSEKPRILAGVKVGDEFPVIDLVVKREDMNKRKHRLSELLSWYKEDWPWGEDMLTPASMVSALTLPSRPYLGKLLEEVTAYGAIDLHMVNGPMMTEHPYRAGGRIVHVGTSPKTEYVWYDAYVDERDGKRVAEMRMMWRFMKAASSLYPDGDK